MPIIVSGKKFGQDSEPSYETASIHLDANTLSLNEDDPVTNWADDSGSEYAYQNTANKQPTFSSAGMNGFPAVYFDGNVDSLALSFSKAEPSDYTLFFAVLPQTQNKFIFDAYNRLAIRNKAVYSYYGAGGVASQGPGFDQTDIPTIASFRLSEDEGGLVHINGSVNYSGGTYVKQALTQMALGSKYDGGDGTYNIQGYLSEFILFDHAITSTQFSAIDQQLIEKYNIS